MLNESFYNLFSGVIMYLPNIVLAVIIFIIGWLIGYGLERVVKQVVDALRIDSALKAAGVDKVIERTGHELSSGLFLGILVKWFIIIVFLVASLEVLQLTEVTSFLRDEVLGYLPKVIAAVIILLIAAVIADASQRVVAAAARAANLQGANFIGSMARYAIWIFAVLAALERLEVTAFFQILFTGIVIALSLAFGLAFGLGGQQAAARYVEHLRGSIKD